MIRTLVLYGSAKSTCCHRVRLVLHAKQLQWTERQLSLERDEQIDPAILRLNPDGLVPILVDQDEVITESAAINEYLEDVFPEISLRPSHPAQRARMRSWIAYFDEVMMVAVRYLSFQRYYLSVVRARNDQERREFAQRLPRRKGFWLEMTDDGFSAERLELETDRAQQTLSRLEQQLDRSEWIIGQEPSLADYAVLPAIVRLEDMTTDWLFDNRPRLLAWYETLRQRPEFKGSYGPGTRFVERAA